MSSTRDIVYKIEDASYQIVLNENFILLSKYGKINIPFHFDNSKWNLVLDLISDDLLPVNNGKISYLKNEIVYTLNKWESDTWIENSKPINFSSRNSKGEVTNEFYLKLKTIAPINENFRQIFITVWKRI